MIPHRTLLELYDGLLRCDELRNGARGRAKSWEFDAVAIAVAKTTSVDDTVIAGRDGSAVHTAWTVAGKMAPRAKKTAGHIPISRKGRGVVVIFGDCSDAHAWQNLLEVARSHRLPMIFVANERSTKRLGNRSKGSLRDAGLKPGTELPHIVVDGNDVVASYRVAHEAVERARKGRGPTLIECIHFRMLARRSRNPVAIMEDYLRAKGLLRECS